MRKTPVSKMTGVGGRRIRLHPLARNLDGAQRPLAGDEKNSLGNQCFEQFLPHPLGAREDGRDAGSHQRRAARSGSRRGWMQEEYEAYGIPFPRASVRIAQMEEAVQVIRKIWTEPHPTFEGEHYTIKGAVCDPRRFRNPRLRYGLVGRAKKFFARRPDTPMASMCAGGLPSAISSARKRLTPTARRRGATPRHSGAP